MSYVVEVTDVPAGATRYVDMEMQAERYWRHTGGIAASIEGAPPVQISVSTWVFP